MIMAIAAIQYGALASPAFAKMSNEEITQLRQKLEGENVSYTDFIKGIQEEIIYTVRVTGNGHTAKFSADLVNKTQG